LDEIGLVVYEEMSFKVNGLQTDDEWMTAGPWMKSDHKSSPCHKVTGELKYNNKNSLHKGQ
jgi:hypothetical protein